MYIMPMQPLLNLQRLTNHQVLVDEGQVVVYTPEQEGGLQVSFKSLWKTVEDGN